MVKSKRASKGLGKYIQVNTKWVGKAELIYMRVVQVGN